MIIKRWYFVNDINLKRECSISMKEIKCKFIFDNLFTDQLLTSIIRYNEIVEYHMGKGEYEELVRACKKFGSTDPNLWIQTLSYFSAQNNAQAQSKISDVLNHIDKNNLLPPLLVLQILANDTDKGEKVNLSKPAISLGVIKDYIVQRLERDNQQIADVIIIL